MTPGIFDTVVCRQCGTVNPQSDTKCWLCRASLDTPPAAGEVNSPHRRSFTTLRRSTLVLCIVLTTVGFGLLLLPNIFLMAVGLLLFLVAGLVAVMVFPLTSGQITSPALRALLVFAASLSGFLCALALILIALVVALLCVCTAIGMEKFQVNP